MDKEELIKAIETHINDNMDCGGCVLQGECTSGKCIDVLFKNSLQYLKKEKEPAPAGTDTSSKCNELQSNNTMKLKICQEIAKNLITIQDDQMGDIYTSGYVQAMREILMILDRF